MKTPLAVVLILMGTLLIMTPPIADYLYQRHLVELMTKLTDYSSISLGGDMSEPYHFGCWLAGVTMIVVAVVFSVRGRSPVTPLE